MIQLHAITRDPVPIDALPGAEDRSLREVDCGRIRALVSERGGTSDPTAEDVIVHAELIEAVCREVDALPVRFGILHRDEDRLREALSEAQDDLLALLDRLAGRVEFVVRPEEPLRRGDDPEPADGEGRDGDAPGRTYLEGRLAEHRAAAADRQDVEQRLERVVSHVSDLVVESLDREGRQGPERCLLVARADAERFVDAASEALDADRGLVLGGPWPPYTFAEEAR